MEYMYNMNEKLAYLVQINRPAPTHMSSTAGHDVQTRLATQTQGDTERGSVEVEFVSPIVPLAPISREEQLFHKRLRSPLFKMYYANLTITTNMVGRWFIT